MKTFVPFILLLFATTASSIEPDDLYQVRFGTLEKGAGRFVFRSDGHEEVFSTNELANSSSSFAGPPNLQEIGFKTERGDIVLYESKGQYAAIMSYLKKFPSAKIVSLLMKGELREPLELKVQGRTPVCRIDLVTGTGRVTLWKNMPE
jgi:hypothetical protein